MIRGVRVVILFLASLAWANALPRLGAAETTCTWKEQLEAARGCGYLLLGRNDEARSTFDALVRHHPRSAWAWGWRASALIQQKDYVPALADLDQVLQLRPNDGGAHHNRGCLRLRMKDLQGALLDFNQAIRLNPKDARAYCYRAVIHLSSASVVEYDRLMADPMKLVQAWNAAGLSYDKQVSSLFGKAFAVCNEAIVDLSDAIRLEPDNLEFRRLRADVYCRISKYNEALADLDAILRLCPDDVAAYRKRAQTYLQKIRWPVFDAPETDAQREARHREYRACAIADIGRILEHCPREVDTYILRAGLHEEQGSLARAVLDWTMVLRLRPNADSYWKRALLYQRRGDTRRALADVNAFIRLRREPGEGLGFRSELYAEQGDRKHALADCAQLIAMAKGSARPWQHLWALQHRGEIREQLGDREGALADYSAVIRLAMRQPRGRSEAADAYRRRAWIWLQKGDLERALADNSTALQLDPRTGDLYTMQALIYLRLGWHREAEYACFQAIQNEARKTSPVAMLALVEAVQGNYGRALRCIKYPPRLRSCERRSLARERPTPPPLFPVFAAPMNPLPDVVPSVLVPVKYVPPALPAPAQAAPPLPTWNDPLAVPPTTMQPLLPPVRPSSPQPLGMFD